jgi:carboxymethylenebutenolidase
LLSARDGYDAAAVNYGQLPRHLDEKVVGACSIVASYGARDPSLRGAARRLDAALDKARVTHDVKEYPAPSHAVLNDTEAGPRLLRPLLRIAGIGSEPDSAKTPGTGSGDSSPPTYTDAPFHQLGVTSMELRKRASRRQLGLV